MSVHRRVLMEAGCGIWYFIFTFKILCFYNTLLFLAILYLYTWHHTCQIFKVLHILIYTIYDNFTSDFMILVFAMLYFLWYFSHFQVVYFLKTFHSFWILLLSVMFSFSWTSFYHTFEFSGHFPFLYFSRSKSEIEHLPDWSSS